MWNIYVEGTGSIIYLLNQASTHYVHKRKHKERRKVTPDYDESLQEYYEEILHYEEHKDIYHPSAVQRDLLYYIKKLASYSNTSSAVDNFKEFQRITADFKERYPKEDLFANIWKTFKICLLVYIAVALPLWCIKGWSCCCLCCKICKPRKTITKAKQYLIQNPPGMQKTSKGHTLYEPTQEERKAYLEFEHLLRII